jgi:hypothetical protein
VKPGERVRRRNAFGVDGTVAEEVIQRALERAFVADRVQGPVWDGDPGVECAS